MWKHWKFHELFLKVSCSAEWLSVIGGMFNGLTWPPEAKPNVKIKYLNCMLALRFLNWNVQNWAVPLFYSSKIRVFFQFLSSFDFFSYFWSHDICFTRHIPIFCDPLPLNQTTIEKLPDIVRGRTSEKLKNIARNAKICSIVLKWTQRDQFQSHNDNRRNFSSCQNIILNFIFYRSTHRCVSHFSKFKQNRVLWKPPL